MLIFLSVVMLITATTTTVSATPLTDPIIELMDPDYIVEGNDNVTVNDDGTWTVKGNFALRCDINYDLDVVSNIRQNFTTNTPVKITIYDQPIDKWIGLYDNWVGPSHFPVGTYNANNGIKSVYAWNEWDYADGADVTSIYFEFDGATADTEMTLYDFYLNGIRKAVVYDFGAAEYGYNTTVDLSFKENTAVWSSLPIAESRPVVNVVDDTMIIGNTAAKWPSIYYDFESPYVIDEQSMIHLDLDVEYLAKTTVYVYFGKATCNNSDNGAYGVVHSEIDTEIGHGSYKGYISVEDILPTDEKSLAACYDENGRLTLSGIKIFATSATEAVVDPAIIIRTLDLCRNEDSPGGDFDSNGHVNMRDILSIYKIIAEGGDMTDTQFKAADFDGDGVVNMRDVMKWYIVVSGTE